MATRMVDSPNLSTSLDVDDHLLLESISSGSVLSTVRSSPAPTTGVSDDALQDASIASLHGDEVDEVDRPDPIASRVVTEEDDDNDDESSSKTTGDAIVHRPVVRGKSFEHMAKQALMAASFEAMASEPDASNDNEHNEGHDDFPREDINDVANDRQLRPYHDLSAASDEFIRRRRECILQARAEQMGTSYTPASVSFASNITSQIQPDESWSCDGGNDDDDVMDDKTRDSLMASLNRASDEKVHSIDIDNDDGEDPVDEECRCPTARLSKRQAALAAKGKLKPPSSFTDEASEEEDEGGSSPPSKRGRRVAARMKRANGSGSKRFVTGKGPKKAEFPIKLHKMLHEVDPDIVTWQPHGRAFRVNDTKAFVETVLPEYGFNQSKITSFYRQLNLYGFSRIIKGPDSGGYYHECFLRGKPALIKGMVRVKVKGGGDRPKPSEIAKKQPNFYDMPPIDAKAEACAASDIGKEEEVAKGPKKAKATKKKRASPSTKKRKSKSEKQTSDSLPKPSSPREVVISPIPLVEPDNFEPVAFGAGMVEDKSSPAPSQVLLEYHRQHPIQRPSDTKPNEITPSPPSMRVFNPSPFQATIHEHVLPPPLYTNPVQQASPSAAPFSSSTFHMHQYMLKQQQAASARSVMTLPTRITTVSDEYPGQNPGESSSQKASDAELLVEDWYNIKRPSSMTSRDLGHGTEAASGMWLPNSPINIPVEGEKLVDYLGAVENAKDDVEFGRVLDEFLDSL